MRRAQDKADLPEAMAESWCQGCKLICHIHLCTILEDSIPEFKRKSIQEAEMIYDVLIEVIIYECGFPSFFLIFGSYRWCSGISPGEVQKTHMPGKHLNPCPVSPVHECLKAQ